MKRIIKADSEIFSEDKFLPLEHQLDLAVSEAWTLFRRERNSNPAVAEQARLMVSDIEALKKRVRNLRTFVQYEVPFE